MLDPEIAVQLRGRGWDVESIQADHHDLISADDGVVLQRCADLGRALVTDNVRHFAPLYERFLSERRPASLVLVSSKRYPRAKETIGLWVTGLDALLRQHPALASADGCIWMP